MTTTIRITEEDRERLHRVQRRLSDLTGENFTLQRILGLMTRHAEAEPEHIIEPSWKPMTEEEIEALHQEIEALGGWAGSWRDIDEVVYGD